MPPAGRHRLRRSGRARAGETPEALCAKLLAAQYGAVECVELVAAEPVWMKIHETKKARAERMQRKETTTPARPGYWLRVTFAEEVTGPVAAGDSSHFGVGLFGVEG